MDDFQVSFRHSDLNKAQREVQQFVRQLEDWAKYNDFKFLTTETKALLFTAAQSLHFKPTMHINNSIIPYADSIKYLGLTLDPRLQWKQPLFRIKTECSRLLAIIRAITNQQLGADQYCIMKIYRMYINAKLDYGAPVYASASKAILDTLNPITTEALRIATGAFISTPTDTLYVLTNEIKLDHRRSYLSIRYYYKIK